MHLRHLTLGDCDEARQARFGCEQIVERGIETAGPFAVGESIPDRKQASLPVVQKPEVDAVDEDRRARGQLFKAPGLRGLSMIHEQAQA